MKNFDNNDYRNNILYTAVVGSRAYGLANEDSDTDLRGFFIAPTKLLFSMYDPPEQINNMIEGADDCVHWEVGKFVRMALQANPNVLDCLFATEVLDMDSIVGPVEPWAGKTSRKRREFVEALFVNRNKFLSKRAYKTFRGYAQGEFAKLQKQAEGDKARYIQQVRADGSINYVKGDPSQRDSVNFKHGMHLIRLLLVAEHLFRTGEVLVNVREHMEALLAVRNGKKTWEEVVIWKERLEEFLDLSYAETFLPDEPDREWANDWLVELRQNWYGRECFIEAMGGFEDHEEDVETEEIVEDGRKNDQNDS